MIYIKIRSPTAFTVNEGTVTSFQAWNHSVQPTIDHLLIFGSTIYAPNDNKLHPRLTIKAQIGYLLWYKRRHQYRIYDFARHAVFLKRDLMFDEVSIGPK